MYVRERLRVYATWLVGALIGLTGILIIVLSVANVLYLTNGWQWIPRQLSGIFPYANTEVGLSPWLPSELLSVQLILGVVLEIIGIVFARYAFYINSIIREAEKNIRVRRYMDRQTQYSPSAEELPQISNEATLDAWTQSFWKGPLGALIIAVAAIIIGAVVTKFTGLTQ